MTPAKERDEEVLDYDDDEEEVLAQVNRLLRPTPRPFPLRLLLFCCLRVCYG